jgi:hypothetical protein
MKKMMKPGVAKRVSDRKAFVSEKVASKGITPAQARQRFFVQTRMSEMKAKGKTVTPEMRKQLQQKFQSGDVARKGFAAPAKKTGGTGSNTGTGSGTGSSNSVKGYSANRTDSKGNSGFGSTPARVQPRTDTEGRMGRRRSVNSAMKPQPGKPGYSPAMKQYGENNLKGKFAPQQIRLRDTELRGSTKRKPAYKTK